MQPTLTPQTIDSVTFLTDVALFASAGIRIAFTQRHGGVSEAPYASLNLGAHVGDDTDSVAQNRERVCMALGFDEDAPWHLNSAEQTHGTNVAVAASNAYEHADTDAIVTADAGTPLLLCFADCVPIILVDPHHKAVAVVHSGWRGTLDKIVAKAVETLAENYGTDPADILAYIGPYIGLESFEISSEIGLQFRSVFTTLTAGDTYIENGASARLDLGVAVQHSLTEAGVAECSIVNPRIDTVTHTGEWFSYRAENSLTGRHGALAYILP